MRRQFNFNHFEVFVSLSETLSFTQTAKDLQVAQPVVSKQIQQLEEQFQTQLFLRSNRGVKLTLAGDRLRKQLVPLYKRVFEEVDQFTSQTQEVVGEIKIGCLAEFANHVLIKKMGAFFDHHHHCQFQIKLLKNVEIINSVENDEIEIGIVSQKDETANLAFDEFYREQIVLVSGIPCKRNFQWTDYSLLKFGEFDPILDAFLSKFYPNLQKDDFHQIFSVNSHLAMANWLEGKACIAAFPKVSVEQALMQKKLFQVGRKCLESQLYLTFRKSNYYSEKFLAIKEFLLGIQS